MIFSLSNIHIKCGKVFSKPITRCTGGLLVSCLAFNHKSIINYTSRHADSIEVFPKYFDDVFFFKDFDKYQEVVLEKLNN